LSDAGIIEEWARNKKRMMKMERRLEENEEDGKKIGREEGEKIGRV
jgi:hypothetical protein